jgi:hypothetical protein
MRRRGPAPFPNERACPINSLCIYYTPFSANCKDVSEGFLAFLARWTRPDPSTVLRFAPGMCGTGVRINVLQALPPARVALMRRLR